MAVKERTLQGPWQSRKELNKAHDSQGKNFTRHIAVFFLLTLKALITTAADHIHEYFFYCSSKKIRLDISCESSARQRIHMKYQALFSSKDKSKTIKSRLLQILYGALRVKAPIMTAAEDTYEYFFIVFLRI